MRRHRRRPGPRQGPSQRPFLQVAGNSSGADITQQPAATSQRWRIVDHGGGAISLVNRQSGCAISQACLTFLTRPV
ncbi:RICIN domain-containing protein [Nonomuraea sp. NPDC050786]|uniref:RICIN domain-containing protein n=1 Tax=Nonomuraea sp. NPDC050786 TaxID=3154840 RepID=UPI0033FD8196